MEQKMLRLLKITSISFVLILFSISCKPSKLNELEEPEIDTTGFAWQISNQEIQGNAQGSTFMIKTSDDSLLTSVVEIESLLLSFDAELSSYLDNSLLSRLNKSDSTFTVPHNAYFDTCYALSLSVFNKTNGAFDPSVFPLVKAWGFFKDSALVLSQDEVDSCLQFIGFEPGEKHNYSDRKYTKENPSFQIDFNAIAQGYSVDVVAAYLESKGQENYLVEIGGEVRVKGQNSEGNSWALGVDEPKELNSGQGERRLENVLHLNTGGLATSGNYRKFHIVNGRKYSHTLDPKTGYSVNHNLLSATVWSEKCALADAYATAFMVMGKEKTFAFLAEHPALNLEVYLLFENEDGRIERAYTEGMLRFFETNF